MKAIVTPYFEAQGPWQFLQRGRFVEHSDVAPRGSANSFGIIGGRMRNRICTAARTVLNIPLPKGSNEAFYLKALEKSASRVLSFKAETLVVATGFDTNKCSLTKSLHKFGKSTLK